MPAHTPVVFSRFRWAYDPFAHDIFDSVIQHDADRDNTNGVHIHQNGITWTDPGKFVAKLPWPAGHCYATGQPLFVIAATGVRLGVRVDEVERRAVLLQGRSRR